MPSSSRLTADPALGAPVDGAPHYLRAEIAYAVTHEGARHLEDVLTRRARISIETLDRGVAAARATDALMIPAAWSVWTRLSSACAC